MSSFILRKVRSDLVSNWIKTNAAGSVKGTPKDSWRAYLIANSGTGQTLRDMETSFLQAAGANGSTLHDKWDDYLKRVVSAPGNKGPERARNRYK